MSQHHDIALLPLQHHSRQGSIASVANASQTDDFSPRASRAFKRGDPPVNAENKYICDFADECRGLVFDRKCEWSKHMDKHDRPYRCDHPSCAKLQGFTYSGGLLRHEREVHNKHGGPKAQLMCPYESCKRHVGKGFTRKENLNEHLRRVHPTSKDSQQQHNIFRGDLGADMTAADELAHAATTRISEMGQDDLDLSASVIGKRKRSTDFLEGEGIEDLGNELKRLRAEAKLKDERIRLMEENSQLQETKLRNLEEAMRRLQQAAG